MIVQYFPYCFAFALIHTTLSSLSNIFFLKNHISEPALGIIKGIRVYIWPVNKIKMSNR